jgi:hypothetical protein
MISTTPIISPRIRTLQQHLDAGNTTALESFWQAIHNQGTPLIESIEDDHEHLLVTFVWQAGKQDTDNVVVIGQLGSGRDFAENQMSHWPYSVTVRFILVGT